MGIKQIGLTRLYVVITCQMLCYYPSMLATEDFRALTPPPDE